MTCKLKKSERCDSVKPQPSQIEDAKAICETFGSILERNADADAIPTDYCPFAMVVGNVALDAVIIVAQGGEVDGAISKSPSYE